MEVLKVSETREIATKNIKKIIVGVTIIAALIIAASITVIILNEPSNEADDKDPNEDTGG